MIDDLRNTVINGDCLEVLKTLPDNCIDCCVTSPPYWGLRDYGVEGQLGLENTIDDYVANMVVVFAEVKRALKPGGTLWLNLGDTYNNNSAGGRDPNRWPKQSRNDHTPDRKPLSSSLKVKDLCGIPWRVAFALQADGAADIKAVQTIQRVTENLLEEYRGEPIPDKVMSVLQRLQSEYIEAKGNSWYLRQDIIWHKPNPMPESVKDRCTKAHEYIFLLTKSPKYYYDQDAIRVSQIESNDARPRMGQGPNTKYNQKRGSWNETHNDNRRLTIGNKIKEKSDHPAGKNRRSVWTVPVYAFAEAHFATFPPKLIVDCILAGCPEGGIVLDPFMGSGTCGQVAYENGRDYLGIELSAEYCKINHKRLSAAKKNLTTKELENGQGSLFGER